MIPTDSLDQVVGPIVQLQTDPAVGPYFDGVSLCHDHDIVLCEVALCQCVAYLQVEIVEKLVRVPIVPEVQTTSFLANERGSGVVIARYSDRTVPSRRLLPPVPVDLQLALLSEFLVRGIADYGVAIDEVVELFVAETMLDPAGIPLAGSTPDRIIFQVPVLSWAYDRVTANDQDPNEPPSHVHF